MAETELSVLIDIRDLLAVIAEPALERRDKQAREALRKLVGKGEKKRAAVLMMDGTRTQADITKASSIDAGDLSKLVKALDGLKLLKSGEKVHPRIVIPVSHSTFQGDNT